MDRGTGVSYTVAVRALCEFTAKVGDLDLRFTPSPSSQEGIAGHQTVTARRSSSYQREVRLEGQYDSLTVRGRADGYDPALQQLEEIKTYRGDVNLMPVNHRQLHWAQAKIYGYLQCLALNLSTIKIALVYFEVTTHKETLICEPYCVETLAEFFASLCQRFISWSKQETAHRIERNLAYEAMRFPHEDFRIGQRELAEAMFKASNRGCCLLAQAPTGIGKTIGSLFPMLKASSQHQVDKLFFLSAKSSGRHLALHALATIKESTPTLALRALELVAKSNACEFPDLACHGDSCPLAKGFYDRLPMARQAALELPILDQASLRDVALAHGVCPYYLGSEMARWSDVIVGDYNYYFGLNALLYGLTVSNDWRTIVLVDEAHNMVARARQMYSAELSYAALQTGRKTAPVTVKKSLDRLHRQWRQLEKEQTGDYAVFPVLVDKFMSAMTSAVTDIAAYFSDNPTSVIPELHTFYFDLLLFIRLAESFGDHSLFDLTRNSKDTTLCLRNIVPASFLEQRFKTSHSTVLFSATLSPWNYYCDLLGMPQSTAWVDVASPFEAKQLTVNVVKTISTRFAHRDQSLKPIAELIARQFQDQPGNYLAFFSSFDYLDKVAAVLRVQCPDIPIWIQSRRMNEADRVAFLANFTEGNQGIGFAVLGGSFGEGIDLPGSRLIGAFIATLGLPQMNPVNDMIMHRMEKIFGTGYDYTYLYPGIQKVVQAAGRVIRRTSDRGIVYLIDDRFSRSEIKELFPAWWDVQERGFA